MKTFLFTSATFVMATLSPTSAQTIYTGHWDITAVYEGGELELELGTHVPDGNGGEIHVHYGLSSRTLQFGFGNANGSAPAPQTNLAIGNNNYSVWLSAHSENDADLMNQPFLGFSGKELGTGWTGNVTFTLKNLLYSGTGTGNLFFFEDEDVFWNSTSLVGGSYGQFSVLAGQHGHGEFAFSAEGLYTLTLEVSGTFNDGTSTSTLTSSPTTLNINVVPEPSSGALLLVGMAALAAVRQKIRRTVQI